MENCSSEQIYFRFQFRKLHIISFFLKLESVVIYTPTIGKTIINSARMNTLINYLNSNHYEYKENQEKLTVRLNSVQEVMISKSPEGSLNFSNRFTGWNFLSGFFQMSLSSAILLNLPFLAIITFAIVYFELKSPMGNPTVHFVYLATYLLLFGASSYKYSKSLRSFEAQVRSIK